MTRKRADIILVQRSFIVRKDKRIIIIRRAKNDSHLPGLWEVPGGKLDAGETFTQAHKREVMEETGLLIEPAAHLFFPDSYIIPDDPYKGIFFMTLIGIARLVGGTLELSSEHDDSAWVTYEEMLSYDLDPKVRNAAQALKEFLT